MVVVIIPNKKFGKGILKVSHKLSKEYDRICYVSLNKSYGDVTKNFKREKIDISKFFFIDAVTRSSKFTVKDQKNCDYVQSVESLMEINIAISKVLESGKAGCLIFDSLSTMLIYHDVATVTKFMHGLIIRARSFNCTGVFTLLKGDIKSALIKDLAMFVDNVVNL